MPIVVADDLLSRQVEKPIVKKFIRAIGRNIANIIGFGPEIFSDKIKLEVDHVPSVGHQRRLNVLMQEVIKKETIK